MPEKKPIYESKGTIETNAGAIIALVIGIGVGVIVLIFVGTLSGSVYDTIEPDLDAIAGPVRNESITLLNGTAAQLAHEGIHNGLTLRNATSAAYPHSNYTIYNTNGTIYLWGNTTSDNGTAYVDYDWGNTNVTDSIKGGIISSFEALEKTGDYVSLIVLAVIISLVLVTILGMGLLGMSRSGGGGSAL